MLCGMMYVLFLALVDHEGQALHVVVVAKWDVDRVENQRVRLVALPYSFDDAEVVLKV